MTIPPSRDWTRPYGVKRPTELPPDDEQTDVAAWLAAQFDGLATEVFELSDEAVG